MESHTLKKTKRSSVKTQKTAAFPYAIEAWTPKDAHELYLLEKKCWAPWLQKPEKDFITIATHFPELQRLIRNKNGDIVAAMSVNRTDWDGKIENLHTWDENAGGSIGTSDFTNAYDRKGNTLCLMSMNVMPSLQGIGLSQRLIEELKKMAADLKVKHIISSLRPVGYGSYKLQQLQTKQAPINFLQYCSLMTEEDEPYDYWLRSAFHQGMKRLTVSKNSIVVTVEKDLFNKFVKTYKPKKWMQVSDSTWECGETGSWTVRGKNATYREDNLAVEIPIDKPFSTQ